MSQYVAFSLGKRTIGLTRTLCNVFNIRHCMDVDGTTTFRDLGKIDLYPIELGNEKKIVKSFVNSFVIDEENRMEEFNFTITVTKNNADIQFSVIVKSAFLKKQIYNNFSVSSLELKDISTRDESYSLSTTHLPITNLYNLGYARGCKDSRAEMNDYCNYLLQSNNELVVEIDANHHYYQSVIEEMELEIQESNDKLQESICALEDIKVKLHETETERNNRLYELMDQAERIRVVNQTNSQLSTELDEIKRNNQMLSVESKQFKADNQKLTAELEQFKADNERLTTDLARKNGEYEALLAKLSTDNNKLYEDEFNNGNITQPPLVEQFCPPQFSPQEVNHFHQAMPMPLIDKILNKFHNFLKNPTNYKKDIIEFKYPNVGQSMFSLHIFEDCLLRSDPYFTKNNMDVKYNSRDKIVNITFYTTRR